MPTPAAWTLLAALLWAAAAVAEEEADALPSALASDDECLARGSQGGPECAANALQLQVLKSSGSEDSAANASRGSCAQYGCVGYQPSHSCQCNPACAEHGNCCTDYAMKCGVRTCAAYGCVGYDRSHACQCNSACTAHGNCCVDYQANCAHKGPGSYKLSFEAKGRSFFDELEFLTKDGNHGSAKYLKREEAKRAGVAVGHDTHTILRSGRSGADPKYPYMREAVKVGTKRSWTHFLTVLKFTHVPNGCGVWPAFFTIADSDTWPEGGELDVLEFVNDEESKTSFHTEGTCKLKASEVDRYGSMPDMNEMEYDCVTEYPDRLGCAPNKGMRTGSNWAQSPGVLAVERTADFIKIWYFPESEVPADLTSNAPRPQTWKSGFMLSYYPLAASGCPSSAMVAQKFVLSLAYCGDWASKVWDDSKSCKAITSSSGCRAVDPLKEWSPSEDCCTQFIWDKDHKYGTDGYLQKTAFWNVTHLKVFEPAGAR